MIMSIIVGAEAALDGCDGFQRLQQQKTRLSARAVTEADAAALNLERTFESARQFMGALAKIPSIKDRDVAACHEMLQRIARDLPMYDYISVNALDGAIECASNRPPPGVQPDSWIISAAIASGDFVIGFYDRDEANPTNEVIRLSLPITGENGNTRGVLSVGLSLAWLNDAISRWPLPDGAVLEVADANGTLIARRPDRDSVGRRLSEDLVGSLTHLNASAVITTDLNGTNRVHAHTFMKIGSIGGVFVGVNLDRDAVLATVSRAIERDLEISLLILLTAGTIAWIFLRRSITRPITSLLTVAERWRAGDLTARAGIQTRISEFAQLAGAFDAMADAVSSRAADLHNVANSLRRSQEHLARAQRVAAIGSFEVEFRTDRIEWSDETYRIFGIDPDGNRLKTADIEAMAIPEDRDAVRRAFAEARRGTLDTLPEYRIRRPDGAVRTIYREVDAVFDESGKQTGIIGVVRDVTDLREAERKRDELERQLRHAQKLEAIGTLAGGIAHDLNNTLLPVIALSALCMKHLQPGSRAYESLEMIHDAGGRARDLVSQILTFARKTEPKRSRLDLTASVAGALKLLRSVVPSSIEIRDRLEAVPPICADEAQIHQVIMNLVTNSAQAIGDRTGTITVEVAPAATPSADGTPRVRLSVSDSGCGMDAATRERIFEPFFTTRDAGEGTGLGLSVVYGIVTAHRATITVDSAPGQGTRFHILFPLASESFPNH